MAEAIRRRSPATAATSIHAPAVPAIRASSVARSMPTVPAHVGTMLGLSVAGYGLALAVVTGLQALDEGAIAANRDPVALRVDAVSTANDRLERETQAAAARYEAVAADLQAALAGLPAVENRLGTLAGTASAIDGASRGLPTTISVPVIRSVKVRATTTSHATSGGSAAP